MSKPSCLWEKCDRAFGLTSPEYIEYIQYIDYIAEARGVNLASLENELDNALMVQGLLIVMVINAPSVRSKTLTKLGKVVDNEAHIAATLEDRIGT